LDELKLNGIETMSLLSPVDTTLGSIERNLLIVAIVGGFAAWNVFGISQQQVFYISLGLLFLWTFDLVFLFALGLKFTAFISLFETMNEEVKLSISR
jgi:tetrahydromethanopterin S-methyltransferase subunit C